MKYILYYENSNLDRIKVERRDEGIHMKWTSMILLAAFVLVIAACGDDQAKEVEQEPKETLTTTQEPETEPVDPEEAVEEEEQPIEEVQELYEINSANWTLDPIEDADSQVVLVTIDDAPDKNAVEMAKTLKELEVPAIFFVNGHFLASEEQQENLRTIYDMGFAIGNHTQTHANLKDSTEEKQRDEILQVNEKVEQITGEKPVFFRAPFGVNTDYSKSLVEQEGMVLMNWTFGYDWEKQYMEADSLADIMVNTPYLTDGANLLMHDRAWTAEALPKIVEGLRAKGYGFIDPKTIKGI